MEKKLAPILLFVYNRPWHTSQTLKSLSKNFLADSSQLIIYADGAKEITDIEEQQKIKEVRNIIRSEKWCKEVEIIEHHHNLGLANSIINGINEVFIKHEKIIVIEDDMLLSVGFLKYINDALNIYQDEEQVMHISAYVFPIKKKLPDTFFIKSTSCWGWGTWKRAWKCFNADSEYLFNKISANKAIEKQFNMNSYYNYSKMLLDNSKGNLDTWAIRWYASVFLEGGFSLWPGKSLVQNIGHDNSGVHCKKSCIYLHKKLADNIEIVQLKPKNNDSAYNKVLKWYRKNYNLTFYTKIKYFLSKFIHKPND